MAPSVTLYVVLSLYLQLGEPCGISTHIEIAHRGLEYFNEENGKVNYRELLQKHPDAFQAGSVYPDTFYQGLCKHGRYHHVSEDSHWTPFLETSVKYVRRTHPLPWNEEAQKLVAFLFGIASHMVADVSWHSLGIDQGFLRAMAEIDFHGSYSEAHQAGDFGGDVLSQYEVNFDYLQKKWYIPVKDLVNIYQELYNKTVITESVIIECTYILFLELYGEYMAVSKLYSTYGRKSPFLVERFHEYFLGGVDDMAAWSTNIFHVMSFLLDNGTSDCYLPENPVFIQCNVQKRNFNLPGKIRVPNNESYRDSNSSMALIGTDIISKESGVYYQLNEWAESSMQLLSSAIQAANIKNMLKFQYSNHIYTPSATYFVNSPYSRLGWTVTKGDLNNDGWEDLVVGAPGCSTLGHVQVGCVYIIYSNDSGIPSDDMDLDKDADVLLRGFESAGRFGSSVAVLDFNVDGHLDLAVGAPSVGSRQLTYTGSVYVYYGSKENGISSQPNVTIKCRFSYCNFGWTLYSADVNRDKKLDLIVGSPYAPGGGKQRGLVAAFYASHRRSTQGSLYMEEADWSMSGEQDYAWFGYSIHSHIYKSKTLLVIGSPTWSSCKRRYCENAQRLGKVYGFYPPSKNTSFILHGNEDQSKMGTSFASGTLAVNGESKQVLMISEPTQNTKSKVVFISSVLKHAGTTTAYELKRKADPSPLGTLRGDREFSRFGTKLHLSDLDEDGLDEIIVTSPLRTGDITSTMFGSQTGRVYIYNGNTTSTGLLTGRCKSLFSPCPDDWAQYVLVSPEEKARFGSAVTTIKSKHKKQVVVAAIRSSRNARLAGSLYIYNLY
ncbi:phosphatidylinositol-glycan-specific phospholipase D [Bufo bufo]|uniref:phosphatidylinositol-glycan-specific phospholipase D n=1 Tax=Bufo bufo TaxID=8384 RepID=UPI001ABE2C2F|nr:phosphatidylinositol-glycan-specific phospholipase D [Bufo bufo]